MSTSVIYVERWQLHNRFVKCQKKSFKQDTELRSKKLVLDAKKTKNTEVFR